jgi:probable rRNA maturation factor
MLESTTRHLEASSAEDVPPRSWERIVSAAETMAARLFPDGTAGLRAVSDAEIRELNLRFRGLDQATDVLSFPADVSAHAGDIALSWETTLLQAQANGNSPEDEAIALVAHGLLHLAGYDHESDVADARMHAATLELLRLVNIKVKHFGH